MQNNNVGENAQLEVIVPPAPPENKPVVNPPEKTNGCEKKRPGEINDKNPPRKLRKLNVEESCVDAIERVSNHDRSNSAINNISFHCLKYELFHVI